ncbi:protein HOTHEAD-like isoform X1 [Andrographis paniculata]|uniref:protein HOTHEAD-like isoform X1 n=1 Tax=Andrographis paniculata TaxID=175694 RepID=UPI0021E92568|nr:protein HOTHEAD-like isoform X1 [Andrographis paniculata]
MVGGFWRLLGVVVGILIFLDQFVSSLSDDDRLKDPNYSSFMFDATSAPPRSHYDYIIVGGGTAGCPLAATLSEKASVLLLERGGSPYGNANITDLAAFGKALADLSPSSPAQQFVSEDGVISARARVLGGGSCLNAGFYSRAPPHYVGAAGWDGGLVNESYRWVERMVAFQPPMKEWQSAVKDGLLEVGVHPFNGFTYDHLQGTKVGGTIFDGDMRRHTAADLLKYANQKKLKVLLHASVQKILFRRKGKKKPLAYGVVFTDALGKRHKAYLKHGPKTEIIISAGALGSPTLLMLSGIGPMGQLKAQNITVVLDQPFVGQGMSDNPMNAVFVPSPSPVEVSLIQVVGVTRYGSFIEAASGELFSAGLPVGDFSKFSTEASKHILESAEPAALSGGFILEKTLGPVSTGELRLKSKDPSENPSVTFNYFEDPEDLRRCVEGMEVIEKVIESKAFSTFRYDYLPVPVLLQITANAPVNLRPKHENVSTSLEQFCKDTVMTIWHYHGGCQIEKVVDSQYRVIGVDALRVIDGSTFKHSPGTNPQATVMMLGRYMGVKILQERRQKSFRK